MPAAGGSAAPPETDEHHLRLDAIRELSRLLDSPRTAADRQNGSTVGARRLPPGRAASR